MKTTALGYSLIELLFALSLAFVVLMSVIPTYSDMMHRSTAKAGINRLVSAVQLTRSSAIERHRLVTLCGLKSDGRCGASWAKLLTVFEDNNQNARKEETERIIQQIAALDNDTSVRWRSFGNRQYLQFTEMGYTNFQNGNFVVCPNNKKARFARQVVITVQGRARLNHVRDDEGFPVDRRGKRLRC